MKEIVLHVSSEIWLQIEAFAKFQEISSEGFIINAIYEQINRVDYESDEGKNEYMDRGVIERYNDVKEVLNNLASMAGKEDFRPEEVLAYQILLQPDVAAYVLKIASRVIHP